MEGFSTTRGISSVLPHSKSEMQRVSTLQFRLTSIFGREGAERLSSSGQSRLKRFPNCSLPSLDFFRPSGSYLPHPTYFERIEAVDLHDVDLASAKWRMPLGRTIFRTHRRNRTPVSVGST